MMILSEKNDFLIDYTDNLTKSLRIKAVEDYFKISFKDIQSALKLQELVKESTKVGNPPIIAGYLLQLLKLSK